jgi:hypothetical protein
MSSSLFRRSGGVLQLTQVEHSDRPNHAIKQRGRRIVEAPPPWIPHGEGSGRNNPWPEDTLPQPRCEDCRDRIYYENGVWWHAELVLDKDHAAIPETFA